MVLNLTVKLADGEELEIDGAAMAIIVADSSDRGTDNRLDTQFFAQFACQCLLCAFARFDFAARKLPFERHHLVATALADEDLALTHNEARSYEAKSGTWRTGWGAALRVFHTISVNLLKSIGITGNTPELAGVSEPDAAIVGATGSCPGGVPMSSENLTQVRQYWENDTDLMDTLIKGLVSPSLTTTLEADILKNREAFGLGAYDAGPLAPPQYLGGKLAMHLRRSKEIYVDGWIRSLAKDSRRLLCEQYSYCVKRQDMDGINLAATIADALLVSATNIPIPLASIAVYLVRKKVLDELCGCGAIEVESSQKGPAPGKHKPAPRKNPARHRKSS